MRGFHHYRHHSHPERDQILNCYHKRTNPFDRFTIKFCNARKEETIGHILMEISRVTKYLMDRGAAVRSELTVVHYRRSPLVQGYGNNIWDSFQSSLHGKIQRHCHWPSYWTKKWRNHRLNYSRYKWCAAPSTSFSQKEENWECKTQRYTRLFQPGNKVRTYQKEKFSCHNIITID